MDNIERINEALGQMEEILVSVEGNPNIQLYYKNYAKEKQFKGQLKEIRLSLIALKKEARTPASIDLISGMQRSCTDLLRNLRLKKGELRAKKDVLQKQFLGVCNAMTPMPPVNFPVDKMPPEIKDEFEADVEELGKVLSAKAYRSALFLCGRLLELALGRKYWEKTKVDPVEKKWPLGLLVQECEKQGVLIGLPGLTKLSAVINQCRIDSVHVTKRLYRPQVGDTIPLLQLAANVISRLYT